MLGCCSVLQNFFPACCLSLSPSLSHLEKTLPTNTHTKSQKALAAASMEGRAEAEKSDDDDEESADDADFPLSLDATTAARAGATVATNAGRAPAAPAAAAFLHDAVPSSSSYSREDALWDRSDALWRREMARWDAERRSWDEREAALLAAVGALQREVGRLSAMLPPSSSASSAPSPSPQNAVQEQVQQAFGPPAPAAAPAPAAPAPAPAPAPAAAPVAPAAAADSNGYAPASGVSFAEHLAAAVAAVASGDVDVLEDALGGHGELLARGAAALGLAEVEKKEEPPLAEAAAAAAAAQSEAANAAAAHPSPSSSSSSSSSALSPLPDLIEGSDDLFWVNALQTLLDSHAMHCGDDEAEDFYFGPRTRAALETFQACVGMPETGVCDAETWLRLVRGDEGKLRELQLRAPTEGEVEAATSAGAAAGGVVSAVGTSFTSSSASAAASASHTHTHTLRVDDDGRGHLRITEEDKEEETVVIAAAATKKAPKPSTAWPILREGDGGKQVHALQVALDRAGMSCGEDDEQWWQFGDGTHSALVTFQACEGLPESGVADERTWRKLLAVAAKKEKGGENRDPSSFVPSDVDSLTSGDANDDDMLGNHHSGMVFLLGEQRWEKKREVS